MEASRRSFLKNLGLFSGSLIIGFEGLANTAKVWNEANGLSNAFLSISADNIITIFSPNPEIGQGIKTAFALVVAEELDVDWEKVKVEQANLDTKRFERQLTGGSGAIKHSWERLRKAGASARALLLEAASKKTGLPASDFSTENGFVLDKKGNKYSYGDLVSIAQTLEVPANISLKNNKTFKLLGKNIKSVDNKDVITGKAKFGIDTKVEGMVYAQVIRPGFGQTLESFDATSALKWEGIENVFAFKDKIAIIGNSNWAIIKARERIKINYTNAKPLESDKDHNRIFDELYANNKFEQKRKDGDVEKAFKEAHKIIEATYQCPFLPHNAMEPMNFFADVRENSVRLIGPSQTPQAAQTQVAKLLNIPAEKITVELTKMGGGFGRRLNTDYALEAAEISSIIKKPVTVLWKREDDLTGGIYRPAVRYKFKASIDKAGNMTGFHVIGLGLSEKNSTRADNFPVGAVENTLIETADYKSDVSTGPWRAPITNFLGFAEQSFLDEVAEAAGKDPVAFRLELLEKVKKNSVGKITYEPARFEAVIKMAAEKAKWGVKAKGVSKGFSVYFSHNSYVAQVAEIETIKGKANLKKITAVTDCGIVINMSSAKNQIYGAIVDGIGHALYGDLNFENGRPIQSNYDTYRLIKYNEVPEIEAHFVDNGIDPTGLGEPALPPAGGALANAIYKATGKRMYSQPFNKANPNVENMI